MEKSENSRRSPRDRFGRAFFGRENDFPVSYTPRQAGTYKIFLHGEIEDARQFQDAIEALEDAGEDDLVVIHLSTNGGSVDATDTFIAAMRRCRGRLVVEATGGVHSAGTIILMNAPEFRLSENFNALIHNGAMGSWGKTSDHRAQSEFSHKMMDRLARETYKGFLTDEEIEQMINGRDIWLDAEEWIERFTERQQFLKDEMEEEEKNSKEEVDEDFAVV